MSEPPTSPSLDDVDTPTEHVHPDHHEHAKTPHPLDDDELAERAEQERAATGADGPLTGR